MKKSVLNFLFCIIILNFSLTINAEPENNIAVVGLSYYHNRDIEFDQKDSTEYLLEDYHKEDDVSLGIEYSRGFLQLRTFIGNNHQYYTHLLLSNDTFVSKTSVYYKKGKVIKTKEVGNISSQWEIEDSSRIEKHFMIYWFGLISVSFYHQI